MERNVEDEVWVSCSKNKGSNEISDPLQRDLQFKEHTKASGMLGKPCLGGCPGTKKL